MFTKNRRLLVAHLVLILTLGMLGLEPIQPVFAGTLVVNNTNDSGPSSLRQAIADAASGDTITFHPSLSGQVLTLKTSLVIDKDLTVDASGLSSQITINSGIVIHNASLIIVDCTISNSIGGRGVENWYGTLAMVNSSVLNNSSSSGGGIYNHGTATLTNVVVSNNSADSTTGGGGIYNVGDMTITGSTISNNSGGGIRNEGTLILTDSTVTGNSDGGIYNHLGYYGASMTIANSTISNNTNNSGGGIENLGPATVTNSKIEGNSADYAGGIYNTSTLTIIDSTFSNNRASNGVGGGIENYVGTLSVQNSTFNGNTAANGGGIYNGGEGVVTIDNSAIYNNHAGHGGGLYNHGDMTLNNTTISSNVASVGAPPYYHDGHGGGIYTGYSGSDLTLNNTTVTNNSSNFIGGGIYYYGFDSVKMYNSIVANNIASGYSDDCNGGITSLGYNLIGDARNCNFVAAMGDLVGMYPDPINPRLSHLQDNGGPTFTHALLVDSPAIDTGDDVTCPATDQRGVTRPQGAHCDIGAYEAGDFLPDFEWNTFQGGSSDDSSSDMTVDSFGNLYVTGYSDSNFWGKNPINPIAGGFDAYVAKLDAQGDLIWYTFLGSNVAEYEGDNGSGIALDQDGNIYIVGSSDSSWGENAIHDFAGKADVFVAKLNPEGNLLWHTFLGSPEIDSAGSIAVDRDGFVYINGSSERGWDMPGPIHGFTGEYPDQDTFVAKLSPNGALQWHTFLGGAGNEFAWDISIDLHGNVLIIGDSEGGWEQFSLRPFSGEKDAYVAKLNSTGTLLWNTFLGGPDHDMGLSLETDPLGDIFLSGGSSSSWGNNPINNYRGLGDAFLAKVSSNGVLEWNTFLGGTAFDFASGLTINTVDDSIFVTGCSEVTWGSAPQFPYNQDGKCFLAKFHPTGVYQWNAFFGENRVWGLTDNSLVASNGNIFTTGFSSLSWGTPIHSHSGATDFHIIKVNAVDAYPIISSVTRVNGSPTTATNVNFTVTFSEPVLDVKVNDFTLHPTGKVKGAAIQTVSGSGAVYTVTVNTGSGNGSLRLDVPASATITDLAGNPIIGLPFTSGQSYTILKDATFSDVETDYWAWQYVERLVNAGITAGCGNGNYCPEASVTRAQMAVFLLRGIHGSSYVPPAVGSSTGFGDVQTGHWAAAWIKQLAAEGITAGCGSGNYCPESSVTRAQMAVFLLRAKHGEGYRPPAVGNSTDFGDVQTTHWAAAWIKQLVAEGITAGCGNNNYCPESSVTRAQMAVFIVRAFGIP